MAFPRCEHRLVLTPKSHDPFQKVKGIEKGRNEIIHLFFRAQYPQSRLRLAKRKMSNIFTDQSCVRQNYYIINADDCSKFQKYC